MNRAHPWHPGVPLMQIVLLVAVTLFGRAAELRARLPVPDWLLHLLGFFLLTRLALRLLEAWAPGSPLHLRMITAAALCVSLGALDEWLQSWDSGRTSDLVDLAFDCGGILIALAVTYLAHRHHSAPRAPDEETSQRTGSPAGE
jgi:VanZ family protein